MRKGKKGAAELRDEPNAYGFITKIFPNYEDFSYYTKEEYKPVLKHEIEMLRYVIMSLNKVKPETHFKFLISKVGSGLANKNNIWDLIEPELKTLKSKYPNEVVLLWEEDP
jgi:hypothetical protein